MEILQHDSDVPVHSIHMTKAELGTPSIITATVSGILPGLVEKNRSSKQIQKQKEQHATNVVQQYSEVNDVHVSNDVDNMCPVSSGKMGIHPQIADSDIL